MLIIRKQIYYLLNFFLLKNRYKGWLCFLKSFSSFKLINRQLKKKNDFKYKRQNNPKDYEMNKSTIKILNGTRVIQLQMEYFNTDIDTKIILLLFILKQ